MPNSSPGTSCLATIGLSLRDKNHSPIDFSLRGRYRVRSLKRGSYGKLSLRLSIDPWNQPLCPGSVLGVLCSELREHRLFLNRNAQGVGQECAGDNQKEPKPVE